MSIFNKLFGKKQPEKEIRPKRIPTIEEFPKLGAEDRMGIIMILGDTGNPDSFPYIKYAIQNDTDLNVKFAALKRVHLFINHPETIPMLTELNNNGGGKTLEPYFSMALSRLGIISTEEFRKKINGG